MRRALKKTAPVRRTEASISDKTSGPGEAGTRAGASAKDDGVSIIVGYSFTSDISPANGLRQLEDSFMSVHSRCITFSGEHCPVRAK